jgi:RNA polymerase sigma-70 factor (ECF subfamily)
MDGEGIPPASVQAWIRAAQAGEREAFARLAAHYREPLEAHVRRRLGGRLGDQVEAEDVVQETFLKAFQSAGSFIDQGPDSFFRWLRGIAENLLLYWAREHRRKPLLFSGEPPAGEGVAELSPSRRLRREERFDRLEEALSSLSPEHREVILMARVEGLSTAEIAARLGRSRAAVKQMLWRALRKLAAAFGDTESFGLPPRRLGTRGEPPAGAEETEDTK